MIVSSPTKSSVTKRQIISSIAKLKARSSKQVAKKLAALRITGIPGSARNCPLANYLKSEFPKEKKIFVGGEIVVNGSFIETPNILDIFIEDFDGGEYPELKTRRKPAKRK